MKITENSVNYGRQAYIKEAENVAADEAAKNEQLERKSEAPEDKVSLSADSQDLKIAREAISNTPETRPEKVDELKQAVEDENYQVDATKVADKIVGSTIDEIV